VPDCYPADAVRIVTRGQAHLVHELGGDRVPLGIGEQAVRGGGAQDAVPDRAGLAAPVDGIQRCVQQTGQAAEITLAVGFYGRFEGGDGVTPAGDQVGILVLVGLSRAVQVIQQAGYEAAFHDAGDHGRRCLIPSTIDAY